MGEEMTEHDRIYNSELELIPLEAEYETLEFEMMVYEQTKTVELENLAMNLSKTLGPRGHNLSTAAKRSLKLISDLKNDKEFQEMLSHKHELSKDIRYIKIEVEYLKREHEREISKLLEKP